MVTIEVSAVNYGGFVAHNWTLVSKHKGQVRQWHLGQDAKFCQRVLGMSPSYVAECIGDNDLRKPKTRRRLAMFIMAQLRLTTKELKNFQAWQLSAD